MTDIPLDGLTHLATMPPSEELKNAFVEFILDRIPDNEADVLYRRIVEDDTLQPLYHKAVEECLKRDDLLINVTEENEQPFVGVLAPYINERKTYGKIPFFSYISVVLLIVLIPIVGMISFWRGMCVDFVNSNTAGILHDNIENNPSPQQNNHSHKQSAKNNKRRTPSMPDINKGNEPDTGKERGESLGLKLSQLIRDIEDTDFLFVKHETKKISPVDGLINYNDIFICENKPDFSAKKENYKKTFDDAENNFPNNGELGIDFDKDSYKKYYRPLLIAQTNYAIALFSESQKKPNDSVIRRNARVQLTELLDRTLQFWSKINDDPVLYETTLIALTGLGETADLDKGSYRLLTNYDSAQKMYRAAYNIAPEGKIKIYLSKAYQNVSDRYKEILDNTRKELESDALQIR